MVPLHMAPCYKPMHGLCRQGSIYWGGGGEASPQITKLPPIACNYNIIKKYKILQGLFLLFHFTVVTIGFKKLVYESSENDSATQEVCAIVMEPVQLAPGRCVVVTLTSMDGIATGNGCHWATFGLIESHLLIR